MRLIHTAATCATTTVAVLERLRPAKASGCWTSHGCLSPPAQTVTKTGSRPALGEAVIRRLKPRRRVKPRLSQTAFRAVPQIHQSVTSTAASPDRRTAVAIEPCEWHWRRLQWTASGTATLWAVTASRVQGPQMFEMAAVWEKIALLIVVLITGPTSVLEPRRVAWQPVLVFRCVIRAGKPLLMAYGL